MKPIFVILFLCVSLISLCQTRLFVNNKSYPSTEEFILKMYAAQEELHCSIAKSKMADIFVFGFQDDLAVKGKVVNVNVPIATETLNVN